MRYSEEIYHFNHSVIQQKKLSKKKILNPYETELIKAAFEISKQREKKLYVWFISHLRIYKIMNRGWVSCTSPRIETCFGLSCQQYGKTVSKNNKNDDH